MAHEYMVAWLKSGNAEPNSTEELAGFFFSIADAMQAEADKRNRKPLPAVQQTFVNGVEQPRYAPSLEEWQPDWSQAPDWANWWASDIDNCKSHWYRTQPSTDKTSWIRTTRPCTTSESFGYFGNWQDSLRKRPE